MSTEIDITEKLKQLREPFKPNEISKLPKGNVMLDYVGHAALTDRLLKVDPLWQWEPLALTPEGLPLIDKDGGLWIKLTICGITRLGYGDAQGKTGPNATKERIGDALRNAGMRFGIALDLWHKGELSHGDATDPVRAAAEKEAAERAEAEQKANLKAEQADAAAQAFAGFASCADEYGFSRLEKGPLQLLARIVCKKDAPKTADLKAAILLPRQEWDLAIDDANAELAKAEAAAQSNSTATIGAMSR